MSEYHNALNKANVPIVPRSVHSKTGKSSKKQVYEENPNYSPHPKRLIYFINVMLSGVLILLLLLNFLFRNKEGNVKKELTFLKTRIDKMEEQLTLFQGIRKVIFSQNKEYKRLEELISRLDKSLAKQFNELSDEVQKLRTVKVSLSKPLPSFSIKKTASYPKEYYHIVLEGENLFRIGLRYNISVEDLYRINNLKSRRFIKAGQKILIKKL